MSCTGTGRHALICRIEGVVVAHIYTWIGMRAHALPALRAPALEPFHRSGRKSDRRLFPECASASVLVRQIHIICSARLRHCCGMCHSTVVPVKPDPFRCRITHAGTASMTSCCPVSATRAGPTNTCIATSRPVRTVMKSVLRYRSPLSSSYPYMTNTPSWPALTSCRIC